MKRIWIAAALAIISGILCFTEYRIVAKAQQDFDEKIEEIYSLVNEDNNDAAAELCDELSRDWSDRQKTVDMFLNHDLMDSISCELETLKCYLESSDEKAEFFATAEKMKKQLQSLKDSELPLAENII